MIAYTPPEPFVLHRDYQVPYWARLYEEVMANISEAEYQLGLHATTWYIYHSPTHRVSFTPLGGGTEHLVGFNPRFANYILDMRAALDRVYAALGTSTAEVLMARFGRDSWANPEAYYAAKGEVSDRDLEEVRLRLWFQASCRPAREEWSGLAFAYDYWPAEPPQWLQKRQMLWNKFLTAEMGLSLDMPWPSGPPPSPVGAVWWMRWRTYYYHQAEICHSCLVQCVDVSTAVPAIPLEGNGFSVLLSCGPLQYGPGPLPVKVAALTVDRFAKEDRAELSKALYAGGTAVQDLEVPAGPWGTVVWRLLLFPTLVRRRYLILGYFLDEALGAWRENNPFPLQWVPNATRRLGTYVASDIRVTGL
jgi:hypothetical protein